MQEDSKKMTSLYERIRQSLQQHDQLHLLQFFPQLSSSEQEQLLQQIDSLPDCGHLNQIFQQSVNVVGNNSDEYEKIKPPPKSSIDSLLGTHGEEMSQLLMNEGLQLIADNQVGVVLLAGGQGTRLGSKDPKGMYDMSLLSRKTLFQLQAERIVKLQRLAARYASRKESDVIIPFYILVCLNNEQTHNYFAENNYFGLRADQIYLFDQDSLPCFSLDGKILLETKSSLAMAPNGNGDVYQALERSGCLKDMRQRGVKYVHSFSVDNVLVKVADPIFIAFCAKRNADFGTKVIPKRDPHERVGVFALKNDRFHVVEYSEISKEMAEQRDPHSGELLYNSANIVNFFYTVDFLDKCSDIMSKTKNYHVAKKIVPTVNDQGEPYEPTQCNGIKLELFNFDICEYADTVAILEVDRFQEFSPLKNAPNANLPDSPETCRQDLSRVHASWIERAGGKIEGDLQTQLCEISPLLSYAGEDLEEFVKGKTFTLPLHLHES